MKIFTVGSYENCRKSSTWGNITSRHPGGGGGGGERPREGASSMHYGQCQCSGKIIKIAIIYRSTLIPMIYISKC